MITYSEDFLRLLALDMILALLLFGIMIFIDLSLDKEALYSMWKKLDTTRKELDTTRKERDDSLDQLATTRKELDTVQKELDTVQKELYYFMKELYSSTKIYNYD